MPTVQRGQGSSAPGRCANVQVLHGKIDSNDMLTGVTVHDLDLAEHIYEKIVRAEPPYGIEP
jgi:hypothetical protein